MQNSQFALPGVAPLQNPLVWWGAVIRHDRGKGASKHIDRGDCDSAEYRREEELQDSALLSRLAEQMVGDVVRVGLPGVLKQRGIVPPTGSPVKIMNLSDQLRSTKGWLSIGKLSKLVEAHPQTVRNWILCNGLPAHKFHGRWKVYGPAVADWLETGLDMRAPSACASDSTGRSAISRDFHTARPPASEGK
jgi:hypothetical protein